MCMAALCCALLVGGCGGGSDMLTAATLGEQRAQSLDEYLAAYADADFANGKRRAYNCIPCHTLQAGGAHQIGPNLHGFFGSKAGRIEGFPYSAALSNADFVWTPRALDAWLAAPALFLPGNRMTIPGMPNADDRADLIAYLLQATHATPAATTTQQTSEPQD